MDHRQSETGDRDMDEDYSAQDQYSELGYDDDGSGIY